MDRSSLEALLGRVMEADARRKEQVTRVGYYDVDTALLMEAVAALLKALIAQSHPAEPLKHMPA